MLKLFHEQRLQDGRCVTPIAVDAKFANCIDSNGKSVMISLDCFTKPSTRSIMKSENTLHVVPIECTEHAIDNSIITNEVIVDNNINDEIHTYETNVVIVPKYTDEEDYV